MKPDHWHEIERLYHAARERKEEEREAFLKEACVGNESLRKEVVSLLAHHLKAERFMECPSLEAADKILATNQVDEPEAGSAQPIHKLTGQAGAQPRRQLPPWWIFLVSVPFATCAGFLYFLLFSGPEPLGWVIQPGNRETAEGWYRITTVRPQSPTARAGFQSGDLIRSKELDQLRTHPHADQLQFQVKRRNGSAELTLALTRRGREYWLGSEGVRALLLFVDSVLYLMLAGILVMMRPRDSVARWGAILLAQLGLQMLLMGNRSGDFAFLFQSAHALRTLPTPVGLAILAGMSISQKVPTGAFGFLGGFPRAFLTGWRAWVFWAVTGVVTIPLNLKAVWLPVYAGTNGPAVPVSLLMPGRMLGICLLAATIVLLIRNYCKIEERNERRRLRIVVIGFGIGVFAMALVVVLTMPLGPIQRFRHGYWGESYFDSVMPLLFAFAPVSTTYAILRHRMFDIHVMIRLGLRYAAARGLILSIIPATGLVLALDLLTHGNQPLFEIARRRGLIYGAIALGALLLHVRQKAWLNALDRRFFREHYDVRQLLSAVVDDIRQADTLDQAASRVLSQIEGALHPQFASLLVREPGASNFCGVAPARGSSIRADSKLIALMQASGKPLENSQNRPDRLLQQLPLDDVEYLLETRTEWLFPVALGGMGQEAVLVLGPKRSEEPYSQEDRQILSAIAGSLALILERSPAPVPVQAGFGECPHCGHCYDSGVVLCETDGADLSTTHYSLVLARRYRFERRLGRGGMGTVYQAYDIELRRPVAVKVIRPELMPDIDALARFRWEAKTAAGFAHPNVVTIHDFGVAEDDRAYLVMELLIGCSLREELLRCGRLDPKRVLEILSGVALAIAAAHERSLIHRDLKPENIFLCRSGLAETAKVLDFGLAKMMASGTEMESVPSTAPGILIGTLAYMAPERIQGGTPAKSWDIWAITVMAFEMLTGVHPFTSLRTWGSMVAQDQFPLMEEKTPALTGQLKQFFKRSLAVDPSQRPSSARQLIFELQASL